MGSKITKQDIDILLHIAGHRLLTVAQLAAITRRSDQTLRRRLRFFETEDIIARMIRGYGRNQGRPEDIMRLTEKGFKLLQEEGAIHKDSVFPLYKTEDSKFIDHDLLANWFHIHLLQLNKVTTHLTIQSTLAHSQSNTQQQSKISSRSKSNKAIDQLSTFIPDGVFSITNRETDKSLLFFFEIDMGTETLANADKSQSDVRQKIINYQMIFNEQHYKQYETIFRKKFNGFRLLFLANTHARLTALCRLVYEMTPSNFIWLTEQEQMFSQGLFDKIWYKGGDTNKAPQSILGDQLCCKVTVE